MVGYFFAGLGGTVLGGWLSSSVLGALIGAGASVFALYLARSV